jgi:hypothetical protein
VIGDRYAEVEEMLTLYEKRGIEKGIEKGMQRVSRRI